MTSTIEASISFYPHRGSTEPSDITIRDFLDGVATGRWRKEVEALRQHPYKSDAYERSKSRLPCAIIAGTFEGKKEAQNIVLPSGFMAVDFDDLGDELEEVKARLRLDKYVFAVTLSAGANGLCAIVRVEPTRWGDAWEGIKVYFLREYGRMVDKGTGNINRLRYVTFDPDVHVNEKALLFREYPRKKKAPPKPGPFIHTGRDIDHVLEQIHSRALDLTTDYDTWYKIGFALISEYGEGARDYFHQVSRYHPDYDEKECDKTFNYLIRYGSKEIRIATFYWHCKQAGLDTMTPKTREIVSVASMCKKQKITQAGAVDQLGKMNGILPEEAAPVVAQVFASTEEIKTDETVQDQIKLFLSTNYTLSRNEVSKFLENDGKPLYDQQLIDIWLAVENVFGKDVMKPMVMDMLMSSHIADVNPIREFFKHYAYRQPKGVIDQLADCITPEIGRVEHGPTFIRHFLRKWLIGIISNVYGEQSPLVLVLTGQGNTGKTQFFRRLLPTELRGYYAESTFSKGGDDEMLMCKRLLVMNDEFDGDTVRRGSKFKRLTDTHIFTLRKPYGKAHEDLPRLAALAGTSNDPKIIADRESKNRRIIPVSVHILDHDAYNAIDKTDLLLEAYHAYQAGERADLSSEEIDWLVGASERFQDYTMEHDMVERYFDIPEDIDSGRVDLMSQGEIIEYLGKVTGMKNLKPKTLSMEMKAMGYPYADTVVRWEGKVKRGFYVIKKMVPNLSPADDTPLGF